MMIKMKITRKQLNQMIQEAMGMMPVGIEMDHGHGADAVVAVMDHKGTVSREDCCAAVMCLIECCSCPVTRAKLAACCNEIMSGHHGE
tara:strand:+ start:1369 stop:1632 length:264 start_codon:yes stop_codon:yes gene_type:complete